MEKLLSAHVHLQLQAESPVFCSTNQPHLSCHQGAKRRRQHNTRLCQSLACWPCHFAHELIRIIKSQTLKACWPCHIVQPLIELCSKNQTLKACWPCHIVQALIEIASKNQTLKACWPCHRVQPLIKILLQMSNFEGLLAMSHCPVSD